MSEHELKNIVFEKNSILNISSSISLEDFESFLEKSVEGILNSTEPKFLIIQTWLLLDYCLREIIIWGLGLSKHSNSDFDLRNELLPNSFKHCLDFLVGLRKYQLSLKKNPNRFHLKLPMSFWFYLHKMPKRESKPFFDLIKNYNFKIDKEKGNIIEEGKVLEEGVFMLYEKPKDILNYQSVDESWLNFVKMIDEEWVKNANRMNKARNKSAHSYNDEEIFKVFGINGKDNFDKLKKESIKTIEKLLKIKIKKDKS